MPKSSFVAAAGAPAPAGRDITGSTTAVIVRYVRNWGGEAAVRMLLELAGEDRAAAVLEDASAWTSYERATALLTAAATVTGDPQAGFRIGQEQLRQHAGTEVAALLRSLGSPGEVLRNVALTASKFSTVTEMDALDVGEDHALIKACTARRLRRHPLFCQYTAGVLSQAPVLFGLDAATVEELECQTKGDDRCLYRVTWRSDAGDDDDLFRRIALLEAELSATTTRLESLEATASELVSAGTVGEVLETVTRRVALTVRAPRYVLAVRLCPGGVVHVRHQGFDDEEAATAVASELLDDEPDDRGGSRLIVDVASSRQHFGRLAALYPDGMRFFPREQRLLDAYANHAAAVLDTAVALDEARRRNETARALLALGRALADVVSSEEVAGRVAAAVPAVVSCDVASVCLWDQEAGVLRVVSTSGLPDEVRMQLEAIAFTPEEWPLLEELLRDRSPIFVDRQAGDPFVDALLTLIGADTVVVVPVVARGRFLGLVAAAVREDGDVLRADDDLLERLGGLADHAATALENAALLEQVRYQALHDPLTGLPNQRLLLDRIGMALAQSRREHSQVGVLFHDLDGFKSVNDTFGHATGDELLRAVVERIQEQIRPGDTVARVGGDEFVVVLPSLRHADEAEFIAKRLAAALRRSYRLGRAVVRVTGSVGIAVSGQDGADAGSLLRHADAAMYRVKRRRRRHIPSDPSGAAAHR
jgi:diguanylate cyclase (GGDEF)-like protein